MIIITVCGVHYAMYRPLLRFVRGRSNIEAITKMLNVITHANTTKDK